MYIHICELHAAEVMTGFLDNLRRSHRDICDDCDTMPGMPVHMEKPQSMWSIPSSWSSSPAASGAESASRRRERPQTWPAAHMAEQRADDDEGQPAKRSRKESEARCTFLLNAFCLLFTT